MKTGIKGLEKRLDQVEVSKTWNPSQEEIIAGFINQLPKELHDQVCAYIEHRVHELEGEAETS